MFTDRQNMNHIGQSIFLVDDLTRPKLAEMVFAVPINQIYSARVTAHDALLPEAYNAERCRLQHRLNLAAGPFRIEGTQGLRKVLGTERVEKKVCHTRESIPGPGLGDLR